MNKRVDFILNYKSKVEKKFNMQIEKDKLIPIIITNHASMFGYREFYLKRLNKFIPILDIYTLNFFLENKTVLEWEYNEIIGKYSYKKVNKTFSALDFYNFLINPSQYLKSSGKETIQFNEQGIGFFIVKDIDIIKDNE